MVVAARKRKEWPLQTGAQKSDGSVHIPVLDESQLRDQVAQTDALRIDSEAMTPCQQDLALCLYRTQREQLRLGQIKTADGIEHPRLTGNAHHTLPVLLQRTFHQHLA